MHKKGCLICGEDLVYGEMNTLSCAVCGKDGQTNTACLKGHYICDGCHQRKGLLVIESTCLQSESKNPVEIAENIMDHTFIHMHGPEHHVMVGSVIITAYKNAGGVIDLEKALKDMRARGMNYPGGSCGYYGACGAAVSIGMATSIITGATPLTRESWALSNLSTSKALATMAGLGGPRCCKRNSYVAMTTAVQMIDEHLGVSLELPELIQCHYYPHNRECLGLACPYFPKSQDQRLP